MILNDKEAGIKIDNKPRKDDAFPVGVNGISIVAKQLKKILIDIDVFVIEKTGEHYRVMIDVKGMSIYLKE